MKEEKVLKHAGYLEEEGGSIKKVSRNKDSSGVPGKLLFYCFSRF